jgi:hypothetical protein
LIFTCFASIVALIVYNCSNINVPLWNAIRLRHTKESPFVLPLFFSISRLKNNSFWNADSRVCAVVLGCRRVSLLLHCFFIGKKKRQKRMKSALCCICTNIIYTRRIYGLRLPRLSLLLPSSPRDLHFNCLYFARSWWLTDRLSCIRKFIRSWVE